MLFFLPWNVLLTLDLRRGVRAQFVHHAVDGKETGRGRARDDERQRQIKALALPKPCGVLIAYPLFPPCPPEAAGTFYLVVLQIFYVSVQKFLSSCETPVFKACYRKLPTLILHHVRFLS